MISTLAEFTESVTVADLDGDGDADVLSASVYDGEVAWYEKRGGGVFGAQTLFEVALTATGGYSVRAADLSVTAVAPT